MKRILIAALLAAAAASFAQTPSIHGATDKARSLTDKAKAKIELAVCDACATVQAVRQEKRKGKGGLLGLAGGAVAGGLLGN